jgi:high-affinity K+ transport system ATPase subunit B
MNVLFLVSHICMKHLVMLCVLSVLVVTLIFYYQSNNILFDTDSIEYSELLTSKIRIIFFFTNFAGKSVKESHFKHPFEAAFLF